MAGKYRFYISCMALLAAGVIITVKPDGSCGDNELFGKINPHYYLTGRFSPSKCPCFVNIKRHGIPTDGKDHYLRKEAAESLARLWRDFHKKHPGIPFFVRSSTRNYWDQKWIWENKWTGKTLVDGQNLRSEIKDPCKRALKILEYSSMPGTSRHHWGTDFDINSLMNSYFERGSGKVLYRYMQKNAGRYGFCQPYNAGRERGYKEEKWHWSYFPLSRRFLKEWMNRYGIKTERVLHPGEFLGGRESVKLAPVYMDNVNGVCK